MDLSKVAKKADQIRSYEAVIILDADTTLDQQKAIFQRYKGIVESFQGQLRVLDTWGRRTLANPIGKKNYGIYFHVMFQAKPAAIAELERILRITDSVLRFMHVALDSRIPLEKHEEAFKMALRESAEKEREREAKAQARRAQAANPQ